MVNQLSRVICVGYMSVSAWSRSSSSLVPVRGSSSCAPTMSTLLVGPPQAQEFVGSFPDDFGCTEKRTPEGAWMQCWEPATSFYGCEPGEPLPDDPARKCFEPLVNYFWYADPTALDEVVTDLEENSAGCVLKSERSLVVTYSIWDQLQPTDDPKILQKVSESFTGPVEIVGDNCP